MAELDKDLQDEEVVENPRIKELSNKVKLTAKERDELAELNKTLTLERNNAQKEVSFYKDFTGVTSKYANASQYTDQIKTKVLAGYTVEDATVSVLAKEGKLTTPAPEKESAAGGSAVVPPNAQGPKPLSEMTTAEKFAALKEAEAKGDISWS